MDDLVQFLRDRLDEDEQTARAASPGPWKPGEEHDEVVAVDDITVAEGFALSGQQLRATVDHIARHDPARVLAEVDAQRRLLALHQRDTTYSFSGCVVCDAGDNSCGCMGGSAYDYPCETLRVLALPHRDHPDYLPAWAPDPA
ncbi:DUF6221 family protein [Streptomyces virginiae]|uniref:DUF6221 family protein n=1 Tax=Streptomyces virginiae TaxID=1961 RepID=UPI0035D68770